MASSKGEGGESVPQLPVLLPPIPLEEEMRERREDEEHDWVATFIR